MNMTSSNRLHPWLGHAPLLCAVLAACLVAGCGDDDGPAPPVAGIGGGEEDAGGMDGGLDASGGTGGVGMDSSVDAAADARDDDGGREDAAMVEPAPEGWLCPDRLYRDPFCDCGCGLIDPACSGESCAEPGCTAAACAACFAPSGAWQPCTSDEWTCDPQAQNDALGICDCGCGVADPDCFGRGCSGADCRAAACTRCHDGAGDDVSCAAPTGWTCPLEEYAGGDGCDCGCGIADPDCDGGGCVDADCRDDACDACRSPGGHAVPCAVPAEWSCSPLKYDARDGCDCGCGVADPDCTSGGCEGNACTDDACVTCHYDAVVSSCTIPTAWDCHPAFYGHNGVCDCGCGAADPDCGGDGCTAAGCTADGCNLCHDGEEFESCGGEWTCDDTVSGAGNGCDCGCGAFDADCLILPGCTEQGCESDVCESCNGEGGRIACGTGWECELDRYGDGVCDCGCGAADPDCNGDGCVGEGCLAVSCELCRDEAGRTTLCERGVCSLSRIGSGDGCDCGCGVRDPDCAQDAGCTQPGCAASACERCFDPLGRVISCL